jgi:ATP-dependent DNA helicase RecQ
MARSGIDRYWDRGVHLPDGTRVSRPELLAELRRFGRHIGRPAIQEFKSPQQELAVLKVLAGEDVLAILPTGSGKSLVFQFPAFLEPHRLTLVISPLRALMSELGRLNGATTITGETVDREDVWRSLKSKDKHILLVSPEMLAGELRHTLLRHLERGRIEICRFVVDEVHCVSDWGHDFRPHYWWLAYHLRVLEREVVRRGSCESVQRVLLTATADERVLEDVRHHFPEVTSDEVVRAPMDRPEIMLSALRVESKSERLQQLAKFIKRQSRRPLPPGVKRRGIVYCLEAVGGDDDGDGLDGTPDRLNAQQLADYLNGLSGVHAYPFSSRGMSPDQREQVKEAFERAGTKKGKVTVVVATNAFGMGLDYREIPFVVHAYPRPSVMEYAQQVGRVGRGMPEGSWAEALSLHKPGDWAYTRRFATAPAADGLLNAFTMPLYGYMYVWQRGSTPMSLLGPGGRRTRFAKLLERLQELGVVSEEGKPVAYPRGAVRYAIDFKALRKNETWSATGDWEQYQSIVPKRLRKVFRYLWVTASSKRGKWIALDKTTYDADKAGTVLQRLNRWVDGEFLVWDESGHDGDTIRLLPKRQKLTTRMIREVLREAGRWAKHKRRGVRQVQHVISARSPISRRKRLLNVFGQKEAKRIALPNGLPRDLRH